MKHRAGILPLFFTLLAVLVLGRGASSPARAAGDGDGEACFEQVVAYPCGNCILQGGQLFPVAEIVSCDPATCQVDVLQVAACGVNFSAYYRDFIENVGMEGTETGLDVDFINNASYFIDKIIDCAAQVIVPGPGEECRLPDVPDNPDLCGLVASAVCDLIEYRVKQVRVAVEWGEVDDVGSTFLYGTWECVPTNPRYRDPRCPSRGYIYKYFEYCSDAQASTVHRYWGVFLREHNETLTEGAQVGYNLIPYIYFSPRLLLKNKGLQIDWVYVRARYGSDLCWNLENWAKSLANAELNRLGVPRARLHDRLDNTKKNKTFIEAYYPTATGDLWAGYGVELGQAIENFKRLIRLPRRVESNFTAVGTPMMALLGEMEWRSIYLTYLQNRLRDLGVLFDRDRYGEVGVNEEYIQVYDSLDEYRDLRDPNTWKMQCVWTTLGCTTPPANQPGAPGGTPVEVEPPSSLLVHCPGCREVFLLEGYLSHLGQTGRVNALGLTLPTQGMLGWPLSFEIVVTQWDRGTPVHVAFQYRDEATGSWVTAVQVALREPSEVVRDEKRPYINIAYFDQFADLEQLRAFVRTAFEEEKEKGGLNDDEGVWRRGLPITACPGVPAKDNRDVQVACLGLGPVVGSTDWDRIVTPTGAIDADVARKYVGPWRIVVTYTDPDTGQTLRFVREYPVIWLWPERE